MENLQKIVLLIDADNTRLAKLGDVIREISTHGRIVVKRAYGNWRKDVLKNWEEELKRLAIKAEQQFDYVAGKNATDMALVIDAMNLLHKGTYDAFVIVASDSDYTPLAITLHESGVYVMGVGEKRTPEAFRNSCDEFIFLENLGDGAAIPSTPRRGTQEWEGAHDVEKSHEKIDEIHDLLKLASDTYSDDDGYVNASSAGNFIKRVQPDFDVRTYGFTKFLKLIEAFPERYEVRRSDKGIEYRCRQCL